MPDPSTNTFKLTVEYDGTQFAGWQLQARGLRTVQGALEEALAAVLQEPVRCFAAGRTDSGVHAYGQVVRIETSKAGVAPYKILLGANRYLPPDVRVVDARPCPEDFDPRGDAILRSYRYSILNRLAGPGIDRHRLFHVWRDIDWRVVEDALGRLEGNHDFRAFRSSHCTAKRTRLTLQRAAHVDEHPLHYIDLECRSFLHNMVRLIVGLALEIGRGRHRPDVVDEMLETGKRPVHFRIAPPRGLALMRVEYPRQ